MQASISLGRIAGIAIELHYSWIVIALLITLSLAGHFTATRPDWPPTLVWMSAVVTALLFFATLVLHELSHALVARRIGLSFARSRSSRWAASRKSKMKRRLPQASSGWRSSAR